MSQLQTNQGGKFGARYYSDAAGNRDLPDEQSAKAVVDAVTGKPFNRGHGQEGQEEEIRARAVYPPPTSTLQQEASRKLNMTPRRTMSVAQELYEGIENRRPGPDRSDHLYAYRLAAPVRRGDRSSCRSLSRAATAMPIIRASRASLRPRAAHRMRTKPSVRPT